jgi:hypothetical protein
VERNYAFDLIEGIAGPSKKADEKRRQKKSNIEIRWRVWAKDPQA